MNNNIFQLNANKNLQQTYGLSQNFLSLIQNPQSQLLRNNIIDKQYYGEKNVKDEFFNMTNQQGKNRNVQQNISHNQNQTKPLLDDELENLKNLLPGNEIDGDNDNLIEIDDSDDEQVPPQILKKLKQDTKNINNWNFNKLDPTNSADKEILMNQIQEFRDKNQNSQQIQQKSPPQNNQNQSMFQSNNIDFRIPKKKFEQSIQMKLSSDNVKLDQDFFKLKNKQKIDDHSNLLSNASSLLFKRKQSTPLVSKPKSVIDYDKNMKGIQKSSSIFENLIKQSEEKRTERIQNNLNYFDKKYNQRNRPLDQQLELLKKGLYQEQKQQDMLGLLDSITLKKKKSKKDLKLESKRKDFMIKQEQTQKLIHDIEVEYKPSQIIQDLKEDHKIQRLKDMIGDQQKPLTNEFIPNYEFQQQNAFQDKQNYNLLIKQLIDKEYNDPSILSTENRKIPENFISQDEYKYVFEYFFINECVFDFYSTFQKFEGGENRKMGQKSHIQLQQRERDSEGFTTFKVGLGFIDNDFQDNYLGSQQFDLKLSKNYLVLISTSQNIVMDNFSNTNFKFGSNFLFMGYLVPPKKIDDINEYILIKTQDVWIYPFEKISTIIREYLAIRNIHYNREMSQLLYQPQTLNNQEYQEFIEYPELLEEYFDFIQNQYNESQIQSIKSISLLQGGIQLLQGPPGTGKTHTLLGLLSAFYNYKKAIGSNKKILICAPSNAAIDEIINRIYTKGLILPDQNIRPRVVRIGILGAEASEHVKSSSLENQTQQIFNLETNQKNSQKTIVELKQQIQIFNVKLDKIHSEEIQATKQEVQQIYDQKKSLNQEIAFMKAQKSRQKANFGGSRNYIFHICCTLNSAGQEKLSLLKDNIDFLIVDEAAQSTEPNNLIPLQYFPNKMVLIGDPKQLPATTFSSDSNQTKYNRSLFERILQNKVKHYFLDTQYRMQPNIRQFPSDMFYKGRLVDGESVSTRQFAKYLQRFQNQNLIFVDIKHSQQQNVNKSYQNQLELFEEQNRSYLPQTKSIGIITPYKSQLILINRNLREKYQHLTKYLQVNTVDSFQGQEKDLIIFSTVRSIQNSHKYNNYEQYDMLIGFLQDLRRMNVAITRAKYCLIVVGNSETLSVDLVWQQFIENCYRKNGYINMPESQSRDMQYFVDQFYFQNLDKSCFIYKSKKWLGTRQEKQNENLRLFDFQQEVTDMEDVSGGEDGEIVNSSPKQDSDQKQTVPDKKSKKDKQIDNNSLNLLKTQDKIDVRKVKEKQEIRSKNVSMLQGGGLLSLISDNKIIQEEQEKRNKHFSLEDLI